MAEKMLILCYSLTGKTFAVCKNLSKSVPAKLYRLRRSSADSQLYAYTIGLHKARKRMTADVLPVEDDISDYQRLILAGPVWGGFPAPVLYGFLRGYELRGKEIHVLLTYGKNAGNAPNVLQEEIASAGAVCGSVVTLRSDSKAIRRLEEGKMELYLDEGRGISLRKP